MEAALKNFKLKSLRVKTSPPASARPLQPQAKAGC
jgi:hypothetical protein